MQFISNGPDIPNELLQAHEDGKVVFFCGAGIGYPAGLKDFKGLVDDIYSGLHTDKEGLEVGLYEDGKYDLTLERLECRHPGGRFAVRKVLADSLKPNLELDNATETHLALLELSRSHKKGQPQQSLRLVTTNFDRIFHNLLCASEIPATDSGDFGLASLTERWASRFVSELFRNYTVCFIGYSVNDPVMRYMMDALAADRRLGEQTIEAYAFTDYNPSQKKQKLEEWEAKGVTPILYEVPEKTHNHSALHRTLETWAKTYRDGIQGKEHIVTTLASIKPAASTQQDDFIGRMLWALSDPSGIPAQRFAQISPAPPIEWLEPFSELRFGSADLPQFGVVVQPELGEDLLFSFINRPSPAHLVSYMGVKSNANESKWDTVMGHLGQWLVQHLNDPKLILWLSRQRGALHAQLVMLIDQKLNQHMESQNGVSFKRSSEQSVIPKPPVMKLWELMLSGRIKSDDQGADFFQWYSRFKRQGMTTALRFKLRELLAPKVAIKEKSPYFEEKAVSEECHDISR